MKRVSGGRTVDNPFVKAENKIWQLNERTSLTRSVSPPPLKKPRQHEGQVERPTSAAIEAGKAKVEDHVTLFSEKLLAATKSDDGSWPRVSHQEWLNVYTRNLHPAGHHFVIHQHGHPVAGTHYDLRLQCNTTSSISFAIMYGLPGDPNSKRLNRNATETRVHNLWNHLIETASHSTGSMLIWDTGEYTVLPYRETPSQIDTDGEDEDVVSITSKAEPEKLHDAFQQRKIRLRLHGTRLPVKYTLAIRLTKENYRNEQPKPPSRKRKRPDPNAKHQPDPETSESDSGAGSDALKLTAFSPKRQKSDLSSLLRTESPPTHGAARHDIGQASENEDQDETVHLTNAYPGATNSINSIHQRKWYLSLDRRGCGFVPSKSKVFGSRIWLRDGTDGGFAKFHVLGRDVERSVVTGRLAGDILKDEGVEEYVHRGLWTAITE